MLAIKGIYDGESIQPLEDIPNKKKCEVIITFIEREEQPASLKEELTAEQYAELQEAIKEVDNGETIPHEQVMAEAKTWFTK